MTKPTRCRCHLELDPKPSTDRRSWWPDRHNEPGPDVKAVVRYGASPQLFRAIRGRDGWREQGELYAKPWSEVGLCWAGNCHLVVETTVI